MAAMNHLRVAEWTLNPPHAEEMPWKLFLSEWFLLRPCDQCRLRAVCSGLRIGSLQEYLINEVNRRSWLPLLGHRAAMTAKDAGRIAERTYAELKFLKDLPLACCRMEEWRLRNLDYRGPSLAEEFRKTGASQSSWCAIVAGSFALQKLLINKSVSTLWEPKDIDVFVQSRVAFETAIKLTREQLARDLGATLIYQTHSGASFDDADWDGNGDGRAGTGFEQMTPISKQVVLDIARSAQLTGQNFEALLDSALPSIVGEPRKYGIYESTNLLLVVDKAVPRTGLGWQRIKNQQLQICEGHPRPDEKVLAAINIIHIGSRASSRDPLNLEIRLHAIMPQMSPMDLIRGFDLEHCAISIEIDNELRPHFICSAATAQAATDKRIIFRSEAFCSGQAQDLRVGAVLKVLGRVLKYAKRGYTLSGHLPDDITPLLPDRQSWNEELEWERACRELQFRAWLPQADAMQRVRLANASASLIQTTWKQFRERSSRERRARTLRFDDYDFLYDLN